MPEVENESFNKNHKFDLKQLRLDVYRLVCYFYAAPDIAKGQIEEGDYIEALPREFFLDEVGRILLQTAIVLRVLDDESDAGKDEKDPCYCGSLDIEDSVSDLSLREACNKIIHSFKVNFNSKEITIGEGTISYLSPTIHLYGRMGKKDWKASVDLTKFLNFSSRFMRARSLTEFLEWRDKYGDT